MSREHYMSSDRYPRGYREDEEMYVYDQSCDNCSRCGWDCPMCIDEEADSGELEEKMLRQEEDSVQRDGTITWCVNWKQKRGYRF